jgi:AraC family transcriptional regulator, arabinose operon regulatory protein
MEDPAASQVVEAIIPEVHRVDSGRLREGAAYATWRTHGTRDWLLLHTISGSGRIGATGAAVTTTVGDAVLLPPGTLHDYRTAPEIGSWDLAYAHFHPRGEWLPLLEWPRAAGRIGLIRTDGEIHRRVVAALGRCARFSSRRHHGAESFAVNALEECLLWLDTQNSRGRRVDERILGLLDHIDAHLADPLDVASLAAVAHLSPSRLAHLFARQIGTSPQRYVERQRMTVAEQYLRHTRRPVVEIARDVGYPDPLYFSQRFRRHAGTSPTAFRRSTSGDPGQAPPVTDDDGAAPSEGAAPS